MKQDWKDDLFNPTDYDWTDKQFVDWEKENRKNIPFIVGGRKTHKQSARNISDIMYAHRMDKLKAMKLHPIEQAKKANKLWNEHLQRIRGKDENH